MCKHHELYGHHKCEFAEEAEDFHEMKMQRFRDYMQDVLDILYSRDPLNPVRLEAVLDDFCHELEMEPTIGFMNIERVMKCRMI